MSRLEPVLAKRTSPTFIAFLVAGDPDPRGSIQVAKAMIDAGVDILELGMPFSDPIADGPTIQRADERALLRGMTTDILLSLIKEIREYSDIPLVLLTYYNIVYRRGIERFYQEAASAGLDGILIVDMPVEEAEEAVTFSNLVGIDQIFLISPTTSDERLDLIVSKARGFLYLVSTLGVTGARKELSVDAINLIARVRKRTYLPLAVGFGISTPDQVAQLKWAKADAIIIGSALVNIIEKHLDDSEKACFELARFIQQMRRVLQEKT